MKKCSIVPVGTLIHSGESFPTNELVGYFRLSLAGQIEVHSPEGTFDNSPAILSLGNLIQDKIVSCKDD